MTAIAYMAPLHPDGLPVRWLADPDRPRDRPWVVLADLVAAVPLDLESLRACVEALGRPALGLRDPVRRIATETGELVAVPAWAVSFWARAAGHPDAAWIAATAEAWMAIHTRLLDREAVPLEFFPCPPAANASPARTAAPPCCAAPTSPTPRPHPAPPRPGRSRRR
jgi:hypothetical protein